MPIRPGKFRLLELMQRIPGARTPVEESGTRRTTSASRATCILKDVVQAFGLGLAFHELRAGRDDGRDAYSMTGEHRGCGTQISDARIRARADEGLIELDLA